jgi:hypothetical protein
MERLFDLGKMLVDLLPALIRFLEAEVTLPIIVNPINPTFVGNLTLEMQELIVGGGLTVILSAKLVKFVLDLIPFA